MVYVLLHIHHTQWWQFFKKNSFKDLSSSDHLGIIIADEIIDKHNSSSLKVLILLLYKLNGWLFMVEQWSKGKTMLKNCTVLRSLDNIWGPCFSHLCNGSNNELRARRIAHRIKECLGYRVKPCLQREQEGVLERCSEVKNTGCSWRGSGLAFQHPHGAHNCL